MRHLLLAISLAALPLHAEILAGAAKVDITDRAVPVNDPSFAKALVLKSGDTTVALIAVDAVAIGEIGRIGNDFLANVRAALEKDPGIPPAHVIINASHCHGTVRADSDQLVVQAVREAARNLVPARIGAGTGTEARISENRRLAMKNGSETDMRRAYSMPRDEDVASIGPIDPRIGLLRLDRADGSPLAVVYHFACHPIMNPPGKGSSADFPGYASKVIEEALGGGAMALFLQGCGGDVNPLRYKEVSRPADAEPLGTMLGASVLAAARMIKTNSPPVLKAGTQMIALPRAADYETRIAAIEKEQRRLLATLKPTNINFKSFLPLFIAQKAWPEHPSHHAQSYLHDQALERKSIPQLDTDNRALVDAYLGNIEIMEQLTRLNTNLALLKRHLERSRATPGDTLRAEVCALRVGDFKLVTFPGEVTVQIGLNIKSAASDPHAHVSGYTNGYIYYTPTAAQRKNSGYAQEDCDSIVAPEWQAIFEKKALEVLKGLAAP